MSVITKALTQAGLMKPDNTYINCCTLTDDEWKFIRDTGGMLSIAGWVEMNMGHGTPPIQKAIDLVRPALFIPAAEQLEPVRPGRIDVLPEQSPEPEQRRALRQRLREALPVRPAELMGAAVTCPNASRPRDRAASVAPRAGQLSDGIDPGQWDASRPGCTSCG